MPCSHERYLWMAPYHIYVFYHQLMFLSTVLKKCFDGFCVDGAIHVDTIGTILVSNCFIVRIIASCAVDGRNGFSAARFSVPGFPFMFFLYTVFHFAVFPVAWFSLHRFYLFHQAFYHLNQAFFNHSIWREAEAIASERLSFLLEFRVFPLSYREILGSILFISRVFESFSY